MGLETNEDTTETALPHEQYEETQVSGLLHDLYATFSATDLAHVAEVTASKVAKVGETTTGFVTFMLGCGNSLLGWTRQHSVSCASVSVKIRL